MTAGRTREDRAQRCDLVASVAGCVGITGCALIIAGMLALLGVYDHRFGAFAPIGTILLVLGGIVSGGADSLAGRYRDPVDGDADS